MMMGYSPCWMLGLLLSYAVASSSREIKVFPDCSNVRIQNCTGLTEALQEIQSDTTLILIPGDEHVLEQYVLVRDLRNIKLVGKQSDVHVTITCSEGVGLAFINITNLTLQQLTIQGCGLSGGSLKDTTVAVNDIVDMFFQVPTSLHIAVLLGSISDAHLINVTVRDMVGLGLLGINLVGSSSMEGVTFANNTYENCMVGLSFDVFQNYQRQIGGGAFLAYFDYHDSFVWESRATRLMVHESNFLDNQDCSTTGSFARRMQYSNALCKKGYTVGAGGGLSVMIAQTFSVNVSVTSCFFEGNIGQYGSGAHISHFVNAKHSKIIFYGCTFTENGGINITDGAGIAILSNVLRPFDCFNESKFVGYSSSSIDVEVTESVFKNNVAFTGGGIYSLFVHSLVDSFVDEAIKLVYSNCTFENNTAVFGSAIFAYEHNIVTASSQTKPPGGLLVVSNISARYNTLVDEIRRSRYSSGIIDVRNIHLILNGTSTLANNSATALRAKRSQVHISGQAMFYRNVGNLGGAISLISYSFLVIGSNTSVVFSGNHANYRGGVFYVAFEEEPGFTHEDCFLYLDSSDPFCFNSDSISRLGITINFTGNTAAYGSIVYGSVLQTCCWGESLRKNVSNYSGNFFELLAQNEQVHNTFNFDSVIIDSDSTATPSANLVIDQTEFSAMPGQKFNITLNATDQLGRQVAVSITSASLPPHATDVQNYSALPEPILGTSNYWVLDSKGLSQVPLSVLGQQYQQVRVAVFTTDSAVTQEITVNLTECAPGYEYSEESLSCECLPELIEHGVDCSPEAQLTVPNDVWVGVVALHNQPSNAEAVAVYSCIFDYCKLGEKVIAAGDFDAQCAEGYNRGGLLCGSCTEGYSVVLGTRRCLQCRNNAFLALVIAFTAAGILLVIVVAFLKVSVSDGYVNGLLFYSHNLGPFILRLAPTAPVIFLPVAFLNLDLGIETCFYNGMDALAYTGLQFIFPLYLYLLMGSMVFVARYVKCPCHKSFSTGKTFATLLLISYPSVLRTCTAVLRNVTVGPLTYLSVGSSIRWASDPSVHFFSGWHAALGVLSILLLIVYIIPLPLILLFPAKIYSFKYTGKMKPLLDAFFAPYKPRFRCWLGIRILISIFLSTASLFLSLPYTVCLIVVVITVLLFIQTLLKPYRGFYRNASNSFLLVNMIVILIGVLLLSDQYNYYNTETLQQRRTIFSAAVVSIAYIVFLGVLLYHIFLRLPQSTQDKLVEMSEQNRYSKRVIDLCQALATSEGKATARVCDTELATYALFDDRDRDNKEEEVRFQKSVSVVEAPQYSEGTAEISLITPMLQ